MTTTIVGVVRRMCVLLGNDVLGREATITALATGSVTASSIAYGGQSDQKFSQKYIWRPFAATDADRDRYSTSWTQSTGLVAHGGPSYSDTTITGESAFFLTADPRWLRLWVNEIVQRSKEYDETIIPLRQGQREYWLHELDWITEPADIQEMWYTRSPVISRNRYFQKRHTVTSAGLLQLDDWTVSNNADTTPFTTPANYRGQKWYYNLERSGGTDATLVQAIHAMRNGVSGDVPAGETITAVVVCDPDTAGDVLLTLADGTTTSTSTGSGAAFQEISTTLTLATAATSITMTITAQTSNAAQKIYEAYVCIGELTDTVRKDDYERYPIPRDWITFQQGGPLKVRLPDDFGFPGQLIVGSNRPFPAFNATRLASGAADTDETDADEVTVATGALWKLFESRAAGDTKSPDWVRAQDWKMRYEKLAQRHTYTKTPAKGGFEVFNSPLMMGPRSMS